MSIKQPLQNFIRCIAEKNFASAQPYLQMVIEAKTKDRIKKAKGKAQDDDAIQTTKPGSKKKTFMKKDKK